MLQKRFTEVHSEVLGRDTEDTSSDDVKLFEFTTKPRNQSYAIAATISSVMLWESLSLQRMQSEEITVQYTLSIPGFVRYLA